MKILVAPDSYKGCLPAREVALAMARGLQEAFPDAEIRQFPLSDGGEGMVETLVPALDGSFRRVVVSDPLGRPVSALYGISGQTAVVEVAEACGLRHLAPEELDPLKASSYGVGELLLAARQEGARHFLVGLGGTATCDGGAGMMGVPGIRERLEGCTFELLCDVDNPFLGPEGAARVFAPQKGASPEAVEVLEQRMKALAEAILARTGTDVSALPGAGAAGGIGGALMAWFGAKSVSGIARVLELLSFEEALDGTDLIITGEGRSDRQTLHGKVPMGVLRHSQGIPVVLVSGRIEDGEALLEAGFSRLIEVTPRQMPLEEALRKETAAENISASLKAVFNEKSISLSLNRNG